jgi:integrase/recombinase XerD
MNAITTTHQALAPLSQGDAQVISLFVSTKRSAATRESYARGVAALLSFVDKPLAMVTLADAVNYHAHLCEMYANSHTVKLYISVAKSLFAFCMSINFMSTNVFAAIKTDTPPTVTHKRILEEGQVLKLIDAPTHPRDRLILRLLYAAGLRVSELCALLWDDLNDRGVLHIRQGKGQKDRFITLSDATVKRLRDWQEANPGSVYIFEREAGWKGQESGPLSRVRVHQIVKAAAHLAGINEDASAHWLRHSHGSHALDRGASVVTVRDTLGHASIATTNKYLHGKRGESSALHLGV